MTVVVEGNGSQLLTPLITLLINREQLPHPTAPVTAVLPESRDPFQGIERHFQVIQTTR